MIKKKKWLSICLVICLISGIGGGIWYRQKRIDERRLSLVYIPKVVDKTNDFWKALILGTKMAAKEYNADIEIKAPNEENDIERQNELLKEAISEEPDAILFSPSSFTESNDLLKEAKEKGIRISFIDSYTEEKVQDLTVATDNLEAGEKLGKFAATLLGPDDQIEKVVAWDFVLKQILLNARRAALIVIGRVAAAGSVAAGAEMLHGASFAKRNPGPKSGILFVQVRPLW